MNGKSACWEDFSASVCLNSADYLPNAAITFSGEGNNLTCEQYLEYAVQLDFSQSESCYNEKYLKIIVMMARHGCCGTGATKGDMQRKHACHRDVKSMCKNPDNYTPFKSYEHCDGCPLGSKENGFSKCETKASCTGALCREQNSETIVTIVTEGSATMKDICQEQGHRWIEAKWLTEINCDAVALIGLAELKAELGVEVPTDMKWTCPEETEENRRILDLVLKMGEMVSCCGGEPYACSSTSIRGGTSVVVVSGPGNGQDGEEEEGNTPTLTPTSGGTTSGAAKNSSDTDQDGGMLSELSAGSRSLVSFAAAAAAFVLLPLLVFSSFK